VFPGWLGQKLDLAKCLGLHFFVQEAEAEMLYKNAGIKREVARLLKQKNPTSAHSDQDFTKYSFRPALNCFANNFPTPDPKIVNFFVHLLHK
jgi:hypothetical protein